MAASPSKLKSYIVTVLAQSTGMDLLFTLSRSQVDGAFQSFYTPQPSNRRIALAPTSAMTSHGKNTNQV